jgi:NAD(P)-dependent dehydrogenase (short-subunit alcohol dehydrogenase family)
MTKAIPVEPAGFSDRPDSCNVTRMTTDLSPKVAIVTGSTQGLGADIARGLAAQGARVVVLGRRAAEADAVRAGLGSDGLAVEADITDDEQIARAVRLTLERFGRIDILVNNACIYVDRGLASSRDEWLQTLNVNLVSAALFAQQVAPHLPRGGVIVNIGSAGGKFGSAGRALYPASKAALLQLTRSLAATLAPQGVRVVTVSPAWTWGPSVEQMAGGSRAKADEVGAHFHPLGRVGNGAEVAAAVAFVCSDAAAWITGCDIPVDGGYSMLGPDQGVSPRVWFERLAPASGASS